MVHVSSGAPQAVILGRSGGAAEAEEPWPIWNSQRRQFLIVCHQIVTIGDQSAKADFK